MAVFRIEKTQNYTVMSNHHLRNSTLSLKAKGLLSQILSLPENWDYTLSGLSRINRESVDAIRTAVQELECDGYITRSRARKENGQLEQSQTAQPTPTPTPTPEPTPQPTLEPTPPREPQTLTPPGNLTLVDDFDGELAQDKQFITVVTRNGHFFYIVIDRAGDRQNVHFLNLVSEYDLWEILEEEARRPTAPTPPVEPLPEIVPDDTEDELAPEQDQSGGAGGLILMVVLLGAIGGGAYYYFKVLKPQQGAKGAAPTQLDEFVFDEDEDDFDGITTGEHDSTDFEDDMPDFTASLDTESEDE